MTGGKTNAGKGMERSRLGAKLKRSKRGANEFALNRILVTRLMIKAAHYRTMVFSYNSDDGSAANNDHEVR